MEVHATCLPSEKAEGECTVHTLDILDGDSIMPGLWLKSMENGFLWMLLGICLIKMCLSLMFSKIMEMGHRDGSILEIKLNKKLLKKLLNI